MRARDPSQAASCTGKVRHETQSQANRHVTHTKHGRSYRCTFCTGWHIGNPISGRDHRTLGKVSRPQARP